MADRLVESVADEDPGEDLMLLPRNGAFRVSGIGRLVAALAQSALFSETYAGVDEALSRSRGHEITEPISMLGLIQAGHETGGPRSSPVTRSLVLP